MELVKAAAIVVLVVGSTLALIGCDSGEDGEEKEETNPNVGKSCTSVGSKGGECGEGLGCYHYSDGDVCKLCGDKQVGVSCGDPDDPQTGECVCGAVCLRPTGGDFRCVPVCTSSDECDLDETCQETDFGFSVCG
jgi:hypothetical protein